MREILFYLFIFFFVFVILYGGIKRKSEIFQYDKIKLNYVPHINLTSPILLFFAYYPLNRVYIIMYVKNIIVIKLEEYC